MLRTASLTSHLYNAADPPHNMEWRRAVGRRRIRREVWLCDGTDEVHGYTLNVNPNAVTVQVRQPLKPGMYLTVCNALARGEADRMRVVHCTRALGGYKVGLQCAVDRPIDPIAAVQALFQSDASAAWRMTWASRTDKSG